MSDKPRKKKAKPENYKRSKIREARISGAEYVSYKGSLVASKKMGEPCRCKKNCFNRMTEQERHNMFTRFYGLKSKDEQDIFIQGLIDITEVQKRRPRKENPKVRPYSYKYYVLKMGEMKCEVCLKAFLSILAVTQKRILRIKRLAVLGKSPRDMRGRNVSANALPIEAKLRMREHIESFPKKESHYSGREVYYLDSNLNIEKMHHLFKIRYPMYQNISYGSYYKFFVDNFKFSFGRPQVDVCGRCETYKIKLKDVNLNETAKRVAVAEYMIHKRRSKKFYSKLSDEVKLKREQPHVLSLCFDFMQNIQLPVTPVGEVFYYNELTTNVFCIHDIRENKATLYIYHEGTAKKTPDEVCSFLLDYINNHSSSATELHLYSDNCWGQNKNHALIRMLLGLTDTNRFTKIVQYFPIRGHSFLPCDRNFSMIKRALRKRDRIYTVHDLTEIIANASRIHKFEVKEVNTDEILTFKSWWPKYYKKNAVSIETQKCGRDQKIHFNISKFHYFVYDSQHPGRVKVSECIEGMAEHTFDLKSGGKHIVLLPETPSYPLGKVPIKQKKMDGIKKCVEYVEEPYKEFYNNIISTWPTTATQTVDD